jgi:hypothetical protein
MRSFPAAAVILAACLPCACATTTGAAARQDEPEGSRASPTVPADAPPEAVMSRFVAATLAGRWPEAYGLLSARWRAAYSARRLELDFGGAGPVARETAARVAAALTAGERPTVADGRATLPVAPGRTAVLVSEAGGWRVDALE